MFTIFLVCDKVKMDNKYLRNIYFLKNYRPSSTSFFDYSNPGLSNVRIYSLYVPQTVKTTEITLKKQSQQSNNSSREIVQSGSGEDLVEIFKKPIKVKKTILSQIDESQDFTENPAPKRKTDMQGVGTKKKGKFSFKVQD